MTNVYHFFFNNFVLIIVPKWWLNVHIILAGGITLILLMWRIGWAPNNTSKWQMEFNSAFKELRASNPSLPRSLCGLVFMCSVGLCELVCWWTDSEIRSHDDGCKFSSVTFLSTSKLVFHWSLRSQWFQMTKGQCLYHLGLCFWRWLVLWQALLHLTSHAFFSWRWNEMVYTSQQIISLCIPCTKYTGKKGKSVPLQAWSGPRGFQEVKVPRFHDNGTE